jgi:uncharacterized membrane protein YciS (DUF1049 family)
MNDSIKFENDIDEIEGRIAGLKLVLGLMLVATLTVTVILTAYIYKQTRIQTEQIQTQLKMRAQLEEEKAKMSSIVAHLKAFGLQSPEYARILARYNLKPEAMAASTNAPIGLE